MKKLIIAILLILTVAGTAQSAVLTFEGFADFSAIPDGYGGLNWNNMLVLNGNDYPTSGYNNGTVSGDFVAFNGWDQNYAPMAVSSSTNNFDFIGTYLTGAWYEGLSVRVIGYDNGSIKYDTTVVTSVYYPTYFVFNYTGVDKLEFTPSGGQPVGLPGYGNHFAMDNFTYINGSTVPEPSTFLLVVAGLAGAAIFGRRVRK